MKKINVFIAAVSIAALSMSNAYAASDGAIGATSTGTSTVSLTIPEFVIVRNMNDFAFGSWTGGSAAFDSNDDIAISGNDDQGSAEYQVTLTGNGAASAFTVARTSPASPAHAIAYTVAFNDQTGTAGGTSAITNTPITDQTGIHASLDTTTTNANIRVQVANSALSAAPYGTYSGV